MEGWAFIMVALNIVLTQVTFFSMTFPNVMLSSTNPDWSLTIYNASSSQYTLTVMSIVALIFVPIVLAYQGWTYYMFRKRISTDKEDAGLLNRHCQYECWKVDGYTHPQTFQFLT